MNEKSCGQSWPNSLPLFAVLTALGFAGNYFGLPLFFNVDFVFGSIFALLAVVLCGPALGTISAAIAATATYFLWNHPYTVITFTLEALIVGLLYKRRGGSILISDTFFWIVIGLPLAWLIHSAVVGLETGIVNVIILKQAINGIANALIASAILNNMSYLPKGFPVEAPHRKKTLHETIFTLMVFLVMIPSLIGLILTSRHDFSKIKDEIISDTLMISEQMESSLSQWFLKKAAPVESVAQHFNGTASATNQLLLDSIRAASPDIAHNGILNDRLASIAFSPSIDYNGRSTIGIDFSDRQYMTKLIQTEKTIFSDVLPARVGHLGHIVVIASPIMQQGRLAGVSVAALSTDAIKNMALWFLNDSDRHFIIMDSEGRVVTSSRENLNPMDSFEIPQDTPSRRTSSVSFWSPPIPRGKSIMERWTRGAYYNRIPLREPNGWSLVIETSTARYMREMNGHNTIALSLMLIFTVITVFGSYVLSRFIIKGFSVVSAATTRLPERVSHGEEIILPESRIAEFSGLIENFRTMADALRVKFRELNEVRETLEHKVEERTLDLTQAHGRLYTIFEGMSAFVYVADMQTYEVLFMNRAMKEAFGDSIGKKCWASFHSGMQGPCPFCHNEKLTDSDGTPLGVSVFETPNDITGRWYEIQSQAIRWVSGELVRLTILTDITDRREAEQALRESLSEKDNMMKEVYHRVKNNLAVISSLLTLQSRRITDDETRGMFNESQGRVRSMSMIHERLYRSSDLKSVEVSEYIRSLAVQLVRSYNVSGTRIRLDINIPKMSLDVDTIIPCGLIVNELLTNALKYAFPGERTGTITLSLDKNSDASYSLLIKDDGIGLPKDFSFTDTKTLGVTIVSTLVKQLNGTIEVHTEDGTEYRITFYDRYIK